MVSPHHLTVFAQNYRHSRRGGPTFQPFNIEYLDEDVARSWWGAFERFLYRNMQDFGNFDEFSIIFSTMTRPRPLLPLPDTAMHTVLNLVHLWVHSGHLGLD